MISIAFRALAVLALAAPLLASSTWYVDAAATPPGNGTPGSPYASLQYAISQPTTASGDTILVAPGEYVENVSTLAKALTILASGGPTVTTIRPTQAGNVVLLNGSTNVFEGFTVTGQIPAGSFTAAIYLLNGEGYIRRCIVRDNPTGQGILSAYDAFVSSCTVTGNSIGVRAAQFGGFLALDDSIATFNGTDVSSDPGAAGVSVNHCAIGTPDPGFWDYAGRDLHLRPGSACIDAGDPAHAHDPDGSVVDQGALTLDPTHATPPSSYCSGKTSSQGCVPSVGSSGACSATSASPFWVTADLAVDHKFGLMVYGIVEQAVPFQGGTLCINGFRRTPAQDSGGTGPCTGHWQYDMNARIQSGIDPNLVPGRLVFSQWWGRDPLDPAGFGSQLSNALRYGIAP